MKRRAITWVMALCSTVAPMLGTKTTSASEAPVASSSGPTAPARPLAVAVALVGGASSEGSLAVRIRSWFGTETRLSIETERTLSAERVLGPLAAGHVAVWVTLRSPNEARLYFAAPSERASLPRYLVRDVPLERGLDEVGSERVAQVVHSSVSALFEGAIEGTARPALERTLGGATPRGPTASTYLAREHRPRPREGPKATALAGAFYRAALTGDEGVAHGPGLVLGIGVASAAYGITLVGRGAYVLPRSVSFPGLTLTLSGPRGSAGLLLRRALGAWRAELELGAGLDWVRFQVDAAGDGGLVGRAPAIDRRAFVFASVGGSFLLGTVRVGSRVEASRYSTLTRFSIAEDGLLSHELAESARLQPALVLEALYD